MVKLQLTAKEVKEKYGIDFTTAESIRVLLLGIAEEMHNTVMRGAFSTCVRDIMDLSSAVYFDFPEGIQMVAVSLHAVPMHAVGATHQINMVINEWGRGNLRPGDTIFSNSPYRGAIHQADINVIRPVFWKGKAVGYLHNLSHFADMGGPAPGGFWAGAKNIYEEGLLVPPMLLYSEDVPVRSTFNLIIENTRTPSHNLGDLRALYGAMGVGERALHELFEKYGFDTVYAACRYLLDSGEREMRAALLEFADGDYEDEDYLDDDGGIEVRPIKLRFVLKKRGDSAEIDFSGTERQCIGYNKAGWADMNRPLMGIWMCALPQARWNAGHARPIDVVAAKGSMIVPLPPAAVSNHMESLPRLPDMVAYALAQGKPERMVGRHIGTPCLATLGGYDCRPGKEGMPWATFLLAAAGMGGTNGRDGMSFCDSITWGSCKNHVWEHLENEMPLRIWHHAALLDSAGPGKYRGGLGASYVVEAICDCVLTMSATRLYTRSKGVMGGGDVSGIFAAFVKRDASGKIPRAQNGIIPGRYLEPICGLFDDKNRPNLLHGSLDRGKFRHANFSNFPVPAGSVLLVAQVGGSGWGNPLERDIALVERDVLNGFVSVEGAYENYGVVIDRLTSKADEAVTARRRQELEKKRASGEWEPLNQQWSWLE